MPETAPMDDVALSGEAIRTERLLLAALCQGSLGDAAGKAVRRRLGATRFAAPEHEIIFRALEKVPSGKREGVRESLAGALTRQGFPDLDLDALFDGSGASEKDLPGLFARLQPKPAPAEARPAAAGVSAPSAPSDRRRLLFAAADIAVVPVTVAWLIGHEHQPTVPYVATALFGWLYVSFRVSGDTWRSIGIRFDNLRAASRPALIIFGLCGVMLLVTGFALRRILPQDFSPHDPVFEWHRLWVYSLSACLQQWALNSLLTNRLLSLTPRRSVAVVWASVIFASLHWPNPVLVPLALVAGMITTWLFARQRNLIPLIIAHATLGMLLWWTFPFSWHHGMRVGPAFHEFRPDLP
jgi:membrane protease YdiL (CAAX protease family)